MVRMLTVAIAVAFSFMANAQVIHPMIPDPSSCLLPFYACHDLGYQPKLCQELAEIWWKCIDDQAIQCSDSDFDSLLKFINTRCDDGVSMENAQDVIVVACKVNHAEILPRPFDDLNPQYWAFKAMMDLFYCGGP